MTDREKIARVIWADCTGDSHGFSNCPESSNICYKMADQILALLGPKMLTPEEAKVLAHCFASGQGRAFSGAKWEACLCVKLLKISEGE